MEKIKLDPKELIRFRLLSGEEISALDTISAKMGTKAGTKKGDKRIKIGDAITWTLKPKKNRHSGWFAGLHKYAVNKKHDMESIRGSIGKSIGMAEQK